MWDIKNVLWMDGRGNQQDSAEVVRSWRVFHNNLPDANSNKILTANRGELMQLHLYGRADDICKSIPDLNINRKNCVDAMANAIHQRHLSLVASQICSELILLIFTKRNGK